MWDLETSLMRVGTFTLYPESIAHQNIIDDWYIISAAWKKLHSGRIHAVSGLDNPARFKKDVRDDYHIVKTLRDMLEDVDIIIGHNQNKFDIKKYQARLIYHGLKPLPKLIHSVDTLKEVKRIAAFTSNRLDYLTKHLCGQGKMETGSGLWLRAMLGDRKAIEKMVRYNKVDVKRLEELYLRLLPYMKSHPHVGAMSGENKKTTCPHCGSANMYVSKTRYSATGDVRIQRQCNECFAYSTSLPDSKILRVA